MDFQAGTGYSVGWFTLALINAGLAQAKKRGGLNWFLVSLLAGPIATLFIVAWPEGDWKRKKSAPRRDGDVSAR